MAQRALLQLVLVGGERALALDDAAGDVAGHRLDDLVDFGRFGQYRAAVAAVLHEAVGALVAAHVDMGDDVDPQPRGNAAGDAAVEHLDGVGNLGKQRIERLVEKLETGDLGVAQIDDDPCAFGGFDPGLAQRVAQPLRIFRLRLGLTLLTTPHRDSCVCPYSIWVSGQVKCEFAGNTLWAGQWAAPGIATFHPPPNSIPRSPFPRRTGPAPNRVRAGFRPKRLQPPVARASG